MFRVSYVQQWTRFGCGISRVASEPISLEGSYSSRFTVRFVRSELGRCEGAIREAKILDHLTWTCQSSDHRRTRAFPLATTRNFTHLQAERYPTGTD